MRFLALFLTILCFFAALAQDRGVVVSQDWLASEAGAQVLREGGTAVDAAVAVAFALAVTHPLAGNIGGGGFLLTRDTDGTSAFYDFRETAPSASHPNMFLKNGKYDADKHHYGHRSVAVPGTVAGLHLAWTERGQLPWARLIEPAVKLAREGFTISKTLADALESALPRFRKYPASLTQFSNSGKPLKEGDRLAQPDLANTLERIAKKGPEDFYSGETAKMLLKEMKAGNGLIKAQDLKAYKAVKRQPVQGEYRGFQVIGAPPPSSGGIAIIESLNVLEGFDMGKMAWDSAPFVHHVSETLRRVFSERARFLGDPAFVKNMSAEELLSKKHAADLRQTIWADRASVSNPAQFEWPAESHETTHISVVDRTGNAVSLTYTLEYSFGSHIVVTGAGFLLNNEMGDFNAGPGITNSNGLIGTQPNLAQAGKRMISSMSPTILVQDGKPWLITGSPGGRTIISTTLLTILAAVDFSLSAQECVNAPRFHHQWLPDRINYEKDMFSKATLDALIAMGHKLYEVDSQGRAEIILHKDGHWEGGAEILRWADSAAVWE
ncbi:MAG: gamma-glutamyltransferase [Holophagales bacterium]|jgi:gamma-glutamyltranspeptidase/glutathione hydrolase|nr:gamma-glutamyltransferase [Holophagales bacterium]